MYGNGGGNCVSVCVLSTVYFYNGNILPKFCSSPVTLKLSLIFFLLLQFAVSWAWIVGVLLEVLSWQTRGPDVQVGLWRLLVSRASLYFVGLMVKPGVSVPQRKLRPFWYARMNGTVSGSV